MRALLTLLSLMVTLAFIAGAGGDFRLIPAASAAPKSTAPVKKARWTQPAKKPKAKTKPKTKTSKKNAAKKKVNAKKKAAPKTAKKTPSPAKKSAPAKAAPKKVKTPKTPVKKVPPEELTVAPSITDEDIDSYEERRTSPWLYVFIAFVLACVGGMLFLNSRRRQLEAARVNFRDHTSNHEVAFSSRNSDLDMPAQSAHEAPTTSTLFARTDDIRKAGRDPRPSLLGRLSSKASVLLNSSKSRTKTRDATSSGSVSMGDTAANFAQYDDEDTSIGSITAISAVRSGAGRADTRAPTHESVTGTAEPLIANVQGEPCSFERYVEIQVATQCWRAKELPINPRLQETFGINTEELIQYEFYWKQKISGNINLRKKFEELEPLYSAKYEAA